MSKLYEHPWLVEVDYLDGTTYTGTLLATLSVVPQIREYTSVLLKRYLFREHFACLADIGAADRQATFLAWPPL